MGNGNMPSSDRLALKSTWRTHIHFSKWKVKGTAEGISKPSLLRLFAPNVESSASPRSGSLAGVSQNDYIVLIIEPKCMNFSQLLVTLFVFVCLSNSKHLFVSRTQTSDKSRGCRKKLDVYSGVFSRLRFEAKVREETSANQEAVESCFLELRTWGFVVQEMYWEP